MTMTMNEKKTLFTFGCPNRKATVERLRYAAALATDPVAKKLMFSLAVKLNDEDCDRWYRDFFANLGLELERMPHHKYLPDNAPVPIEESVSDYRKRVLKQLRERRTVSNRPVK